MLLRLSRNNNEQQSWYLSPIFFKEHGKVIQCVVNVKLPSLGKKDLTRGFLKKLSPFLSLHTYHIYEYLMRFKATYNFKLL